eukprot:4972174-Pleurochrysis_carterae.AAC.1
MICTHARTRTHSHTLTGSIRRESRCPTPSQINVFSGRVLEIEGLGHLKCEQAFELSDASAERSAAGCTIKLDKEPIIEYLTSNVTMLKWMIAEGYGERKTIERRIASMENWLENPVLMKARDRPARPAAPTS